MTVPPVPFLYLRHGETDWNAAGRAQGSSDIPLNDLGRAQAAAAAALLRSERVDRVVASPLGRARETAAIVARRLGREPAVVDDGLREVAFGTAEGGPMGAWYEDWLAGLPPPEGGEDFAAVGARGAAALARHLAPGVSTLFVAHGALFRAIRAVLGLPTHMRLANGAPMACRPGPDGGWSIAPLDDAGR